MLNNFWLGSCLAALAGLQPIGVSALLERHRVNAISSGTISSHKLKFTGAGGRDVYNPTKPFSIKFLGQMVHILAARVESRDSEVSEVMFFAKAGDYWSVVENSPVFKLQDPFFTFVDEEFVFGGVEVREKNGGGYDYKTVFYKGRSLESVTQFTEGPQGMKDIRLVQLNDKKIGLFTRPQGKISGTDIDAGPGKIGFTVIQSLTDLTATTI